MTSVKYAYQTDIKGYPPFFDWAVCLKSNFFILLFRHFSSEKSGFPISVPTLKSTDTMAIEFEGHVRQQYFPEVLPRQILICK